MSQAELGETREALRRVQSESDSLKAEVIALKRAKASLQQQQQPPPHPVLHPSFHLYNIFSSNFFSGRILLF